LSKIEKSRAAHWDDVYSSRLFDEVSWYQPVPDVPLALIGECGVAPCDPVIDVGGGASTLVDCLLDRGFADISVLDIAPSAIEQSRARLGERASLVNWLPDDVTEFLPERRYRLWHDRAVLHFLIDEADRAQYVAVLKQALAPGGSLVLATFGPDGPQKCSGLEIRRYNVDMLVELLGPEFELRSQELEEHVTPRGATQQFLYTSWRRA